MTDVQTIVASMSQREREFLIAVCGRYKLRLADREEDRARQGCRRKGLVEVLMKPRRWSPTITGLAVRQALKEERARQLGEQP